MLALLGAALIALAALGAAAVALLLMPELRAAPAAWMERQLFPDANTVNLVGGGKARAAGPPRSVFRVLAFGDSLTEGFTDGGNAFHPYAKRLGDRLYPEMPKGWHLEIEEQGESGERVLLGMRHRLQRTLDEHAAAARHYDWVLLLAGINDLAGNESTPAEVAAGLDVLVQACLAHGAHVLLMTLMEVAQPEPGVEAARAALNDLLRDYVSQRAWDKGAAPGGSAGGGAPAPLPAPAAAAARGGGGGGAPTPVARRGAPAVHLFDLAAALPFQGLPEEQRWQLWDDGVHLTMAGYDHLGGLVADALLPLVDHELQDQPALGGGAADKKRS
ncbi:hypothetical protein HT031_004716 [Scenedesmus sp. PABB004]|nr:hypothetical protein HT031_004716 [Scenedesmus sp. PABB004]